MIIEHLYALSVHKLGSQEMQEQNDLPSRRTHRATIQEDTQSYQSNLTVAESHEQLLQDLLMIFLQSFETKSQRESLGTRL